jgi:hypothetical protein
MPADDAVAAFSPLAAGDLCSLALLAGCGPQHLPAVLAAVRAVDAMITAGDRDTVLDPEAAHVVVVNGPARRQLDVNAGIGAFGPGWRANATIGRALRFVLRHAGMPPAAAFGDPGQYSFCFGEDEEGADWAPLHVERGFAADQSTVTVQVCTKAGRNFDRASTALDDFADRMALFLRDSVGATDWFGATPLHVLVVVSQEWRRQLVAGGWSKADLRAQLLPRLTADDGYGHPLALTGVDDLSIVGAGGPAEASVWCLVGRAGRPVTQPIPATEASS